MWKVLKTRTKVQSVGRQYFCTWLTFILDKFKIVSIDNSTRVSQNLSFPLSFGRIVNWISFNWQFDQGLCGLVWLLLCLRIWREKKLIVGRLIATHWPTEKLNKQVASAADLPRTQILNQLLNASQQHWKIVVVAVVIVVAINCCHTG